MTVLFIDSFDHYTDPADKYTSVLGTMSITSGGRRGTNCLYSANGGGTDRIEVHNPLADKTTLVFGFALNTTNVVSNGTYGKTGILLTENTSSQVCLVLELDGSLATRRGHWNNTIISQTPAGVITGGSWYFIEWKITIDNTSGVSVVKVNGIEKANDTGLDSQNTANAWADLFKHVHYRGGSGGTKTDDFYALDTVGSIANDFLGDIAVETILPDGAGTSTDWTPSAGSNYQCVDESDPNDDTDYVSEATVGDHDTYSYANMAATSGSIYAVQSSLYARKDDAGSRSIKAMIRSGGTDYNPGGTHGLSDNYLYFLDVFETDPNTSSAWTISGVNAAEFGPKLES